DASESLMKQLASWTDATLLQEDDMYGMTWKRGYTLTALVHHQAHHRGQMTVLMRQAGLVVPDIYGPTQEGWTAMGMEAPKI
ncbi:MAG: DinB family protein, partial [Firmicutes bacterium]|nr:DinB family protein [Bacillota bacterium]